MTTSSHLFDANWYLTSPRTPSFLSRISPNLGFYAPMVWIVFKAGCNAMRNQYDGEAWTQSSEGIAHALESVGCRIEATGLEHFRSLEGPCVFIGNHMSTLETFVLPSMIQPWKDVTFVVKESLLKYPFFGPVRAGVPVIPVALKTDAWGNGNLLKDFGPVDVKKTIHFEFGAPMRIEGTGKAEHQQITEFIIDRLGVWGREIGE